ncbi:MAG: hypothetical protein JSW00_01685 [Thermoplasmata archaeon]|nr:MAG: hypothetical protein JSW00_01685 [Thermoplasmata archaeon]
MNVWDACISKLIYIYIILERYIIYYTKNDDIMNYSPQMQLNACQYCNGPLTYIPQYNQWYCYRCNVYTLPPQVQQPAVQPQPPVAKHQYFPQPAEKPPPPKQKRKVFPIIATAFVVIMLVLAVYAYTVLYKPPDENDMVTINDVSKIRELDVLQDVPVMYLTEDELRQDIIQSLEPEDYEEMEELRLVMDALFLLDYEENLTQIILDAYSSQILGFYKPEEKEVWLVEGHASIMDRVILSHEFTHALQDQHFNLTAFEKGADSEEDAAREAVVEGDASLTENIYKDTLSTSEKREYNKEISKIVGSSVYIPEMVLRLMYFPYLYGEEFVEEIYDDGGWDEVNKLYYDPPVSTEQIMHIEKYHQREEPVSVSFDKNVQGMDLVFEEIMGEYTLYVMLVNYISESDAADAAEGWGGDKYYYYKNDTDYLSVLKITWDTTGEASEFYSIYQDYMDALPTKYQGIINEDRLRININQKVTTIYHSSDSDIIDQVE